jgi:hypothetical protein
MLRFSTSDYRIAVSDFQFRPRKWHPLELPSNDGETMAMNIGAGALVRTTVARETWATETDGALGISTSTELVDGIVVKRWVAEVNHPEYDEEEGRQREGYIHVLTEYGVIPWQVFKDEQDRDREKGVLVSVPKFQLAEVASEEPVRFRWYNADRPMPTPTDEQVRAVVEQRPGPTAIEALHQALLASQARVAELELQVKTERVDLQFHEKPSAGDDVTFWCSMSTNHSASEKETNTIGHWTGLSEDELDEMSHEELEAAIGESFDTWLYNFLDSGWSP